MEEYIGEISVKKKPSLFFRWAVLFFISLAMFGNYYVYDSIAPVADLLKNDLKFSDEDIGWLNSIYSFSAILVLLIGGIIIDKWGTKKSSVLFGSICAIAGFLTAASSDFNYMLAGRFLLGIGSEPLIVAITAAIAKWFKGKELSFAMGINLLIARSGSVSADNSPTFISGLYEGGWQGPLFFAAFVGILSLVGVLVYFILESSGEKKYILSEAGETDKLKIKDLFSFSKSFWYITLLCVTFYSAVFPFRTFAIKYFMEAHNLTREAAGGLNSILPLSAMIATPVIGLLVDFIGKRALLMMIGSVLLLPVYLLMGYTGLNLFVIIAIMGLSFSLIPAVMWPSVAYIVEEKRLGSAYALMTLIQQAGVMLFNWLIGLTNDFNSAGAENPAGYNMGLWIFSVLGILGFFFAFKLRKAETSPEGHGLEKGMKQI